ncbi:MAG TPA: GAF domain-containing protein, partial [Chloroflexota bacterium]
MRLLARGPGLLALSGRLRARARDRPRWAGLGPAVRRALVRSDAERFLIGASRELASHLDPDRTARRAAQLAVPYLASLCTIDLIEEDGTIRRAGAAHADPTLLREPVSRPLDPRDDDPVAALLRPRRATPFAAADEAGRAVALDASRSATLGQLGCASGIGVPLVDGNRRLGVMILARARAARAPRPADLAIADAFGQSVALALTNARLRQIADQAIRTRDELLSMAIHELRGPTARIALRADLLRADLLYRSGGQDEDPAPSRQAEGLAQIAAAAMKMGRTIDELQEVVTLQPGQRPELTRRPVDLVAAARRAAATHAVDAGRSIDFRADQ